LTKKIGCFGTKGVKEKYGRKFYKLSIGNRIFSKYYHIGGCVDSNSHIQNMALAYHEPRRWVTKC
jgi:hypothetical protein